MKSWQLVLFAAVLLVANVAAYAGPQAQQWPLQPLPQRREANEAGLTPEQLRLRAICTHNYQCQDSCICMHTIPEDPLKYCVCYNGDWPAGKVYCRRSEYL